MKVETESVFLPEMIHHVVNCLKPMAERKGLSLQVIEEDAKTSLIQSDPRKLRQVFINLIANAIKFTDQGSITIRIAYDRSGGKISTAISDTGIGISEEDLPKIFEPFYQTESSGGRSTLGTGLGLAITRQFVERLGGTIQVSSYLGIGSIFTVVLPLEFPDWDSRSGQTGY